MGLLSCQAIVQSKQKEKRKKEQGHRHQNTRLTYAPLDAPLWLQADLKKAGIERPVSLDSL